MSLRGALNFVRRQNRKARTEARSPDLTWAALAEDIEEARERVARLRDLLAKAEGVLRQRQWEMEIYACHGRAPKRKGLARRVAEMAEAQRRSTMRQHAPATAKRGAQ